MPNAMPIILLSEILSATDQQAVWIYFERLAFINIAILPCASEHQSTTFL